VTPAKTGVTVVTVKLAQRGAEVHRASKGSKESPARMVEKEIKVLWASPAIRDLKVIKAKSVILAPQDRLVRLVQQARQARQAQQDQKAPWVKSISYSVLWTQALVRQVLFG
jgi:hypothetical protein